MPPVEEAALDFTVLGVQAVAAAAAVGVLWFAARKDSRDARTEFQQSIETLMANRLNVLNEKIDSIRTENADIKTRLNSIDDHLRQRKAK